MITAAGKLLRKFRIDRNEYQKDMATKLEITTSYLSAIENGKRNFTDEIAERICKVYDLPDDKASELRQLAIRSRMKFEIDLYGLPMDKQRMITLILQRVDNLTEEQVKVICEVAEQKQ